MKTAITIVALVALLGCHAPAPQPLSVPPVQSLAVTLGKPVLGAVSASGGVKPYNFSIISGAMPPGLTMDPVTGVISGTPTLRGVFHFQVQVKDSSN